MYVRHFLGAVPPFASSNPPSLTCHAASRTVIVVNSAYPAWQLHLPSVADIRAIGVSHSELVPQFSTPVQWSFLANATLTDILYPLFHQLF